ncbi:hypothetical protein OUZ56_022852 [Daphnia magna]|uniref:Major facilitator superfamily (MFS) profile domain-containing protein n=1 Tax=Daphnia magna TaxID=35525 RepID=A0ABR0AXY1_9CRUS|nr:hypothetical protein OUZ56_022852 [Daphnia magna]
MEIIHQDCLCIEELIHDSLTRHERFSKKTNRPVREKTTKRKKKHTAIQELGESSSTVIRIICVTSTSWAMLCTGLVRGWSSSAIPQLTSPNNGTLIIATTVRHFWKLADCIFYGIIWSSDDIGHPLNTLVLFVGRVVTGLITGASSSTFQIYVSECSSPRVRRALGSLTSTFISFGILIAYVVGALVEWQIMCFVIGSLPIVLGLAMLLIPETPSWLVSQNREPQAKDALQQLRGECHVVCSRYTNIESEFQRIKTKASYAKILTRDLLIKPLGSTDFCDAHVRPTIQWYKRHCLLFCKRFPGGR